MYRNQTVLLFTALSALYDVAYGKRKGPPHCWDGPSRSVGVALAHHCPYASCIDEQLREKINSFPSLRQREPQAEAHRVVLGRIGR